MHVLRVFWLNRDARYPAGENSKFSLFFFHVWGTDRDADNTRISHSPSSLQVSAPVRERHF